MFLLLLLLLSHTVSFELSSQQIAAVRHNEKLLRVALGVDHYRSGSFPSILDDSLFPRPSRLQRSSSSSPSSGVASRHHVQYPVNTYISNTGTLYVAAFQANHVYKVHPDGELELFARGVYCNNQQPCVVLSGPWGIAGHLDQIYITSFSTDQILIFNATDTTFLGSLGNSEELNAPEGLFVHFPFLYVSSYLSGTIVQYNVVTRQMVRVVVRDLPGPEGLTFLVNSQLLAVACHTDHSIRLIDVRYENNITSSNWAAAGAEGIGSGSEVARITNVTGGGSWIHPVGVISRATSAAAANSLRKDVLYVSAQLNNGTSDVVLAFNVQRTHNKTVVSLKSTWHAMKELKGGSGLSISEDATTLFVAAYQSHRVLAYAIDHSSHKLELKASIRV